VTTPAGNAAVTYLIWDSSALGKRYVAERGAEVVDALMERGLPMVSAYLVYVEVASVIRRHRNNGLIGADELREARLLLEADMLLNPNMTLLPVNDSGLIASMPLSDTHNLNSSDAALLYVFREYARQTGNKCLFLAAESHWISACW
jgi:predicted nucleic acid-binding protein